MNGEADNSRFVSMHVYMHLAFKELNTESLQHGHGTSWVGCGYLTQPCPMQHCYMYVRMSAYTKLFTC